MPDIKNVSSDTQKFLAMLAHDMKSPVKAQIRGMNLLYSGLFGEFSDEAKNIILNIIASNKYLECLVDGILSRYRLNNQVFCLNKTSNDLRKTLEEALCNIGILSEVKGQKIVINYLAKDFRRFYDEIEIQRVVVNLLSNAFEHARENSEINISIQNVQNEIELLIESDLIFGLNDAKYAEKSLFGRGCGLGLVICGEIIKTHNGCLVQETTKSGKYISGFVLP